MPIIMWDFFPTVFQPSPITQHGIGRGTLSCFNLHASFCMIFHQNEHLCVVHNFSGDDSYMAFMRFMFMIWRWWWFYFQFNFFFIRLLLQCPLAASSSSSYDIISFSSFFFWASQTLKAFSIHHWRPWFIYSIILAHIYSQHSHFRYSCVFYWVLLHAVHFCG